MAEVVLSISDEDGRDSCRLTDALDAFTKWTQESGLFGETEDSLDIMMMTEHSGGQVRRKLVFQNRDHAARFLSFWRIERSRPAASEGGVATA